MTTERASGILLHPTSFPGRFGSGDLGAAAYRFVDFLAGSAQQLWQIMPLGPTGYGDSPYSAVSAFAGNPLLVSLERLADEHLLAPSDLERATEYPEHVANFGGAYETKRGLLRLASQNFDAQGERRQEFDRFVAEQREWLDDFALYAALKEQHGGSGWDAWSASADPEGRAIAMRWPEALERWRSQLAGEVRYHQFVQWQFFRQWSALKKHANDRGIRIIGDIPIFVAYDSSDAWAHPELFHFDEEGRQTVVAGVPPDAFSPTGQRWGNPLYRWDRMAEDDYAWWMARFRSMLEMVDIIRIDHFRGFAAYWAVPAGEETAERGKWMPGPGADLFRSIEHQLGRLPIIVEDLGIITPDVERLRDALGFPGMAVLHFAFYDDPDHQYLPHNYSRNLVVYTGTHDNDTTRGWWQTLEPKSRHQVQKYLGLHGDDISWDLIRLAMESVADTVIVPLQDVLKLGPEARMNVPGIPQGNWTWRYEEWMLCEPVRNRLRELTESYGRHPHRRRVRGPEDIPRDYPNIT